MITHLKRFGKGIWAAVLISVGLGAIWFMQDVVIPTFPAATIVVFAAILLYGLGGLYEAFRRQ